MATDLKMFIQEQIASAAEILPLTKVESDYYSWGVHNTVIGGFPLRHDATQNNKSYYLAGEMDGMRYMKQRVK